MNGFSLIEILAALALIAFGMLGLVRGILNGAQHSTEGVAYAIAYMQAENMYELMHANPVGAHGGAYSNSALLINCNPCDPLSQAKKELTQWQTQLAAQLISGIGGIVSQGVEQKISVEWQTSFETQEELIIAGKI